MRIATVFTVAGILLCGTAMAGSLASDPNAYVNSERTWRDSVTMTNDDLSATVDWCVYGPGDYPGTGYSPASNEFVYAYQVSGLGSDDVLTFSVRMLESNEADDIGYDATIGLTGDTMHNLAYFTYPPGEENDLANWDWFAGLSAGGVSYALVFSSVNEPLMLDGRIQNGEFATGELPSPSDVIPEPTTVGLLAAGGALVLLRRRRWPRRPGRTRDAARP